MRFVKLILFLKGILLETKVQMHNITQNIDHIKLQESSFLSSSLGFYCYFSAALFSSGYFIFSTKFSTELSTDFPANCSSDFPTDVSSEFSTDVPTDSSSGFSSEEAIF